MCGAGPRGGGGSLMGLDAVVRCRCWQDGLASDPPVPVELLVTSRFRQRRLSEPDEPPLYEITDGEGRTITTPIGFSTGRWIGEEWAEAEPAKLLVRARQVPVLNHWRAIVSRLRRIFSASVETGNPVLWC